MPEYSLVGDYFQIKDEEGLIKIRFPQRWWEYYQELFNFSNASELLLEKRREIFLYAIRDLKKFFISLEDVSCICYKLNSDDLKDLSEKEIEFNEILSKCIKLSYLIRQKKSSQDFKECHQVIMDYYTKHLTEEIEQKDRTFWIDYKEQIDREETSADIQYFKSDDLRDDEEDFTHWQKGFLLLMSDFLSGKVVTSCLTTKLPRADEVIHKEMMSKESEYLYFLFFRMVESTFDLVFMGWSYLYEEAIDYYRKYQYLIDKQRRG